MTKSNLYNIYGEIIFQKVALGYLLHFVHNESKNNILQNMFFAQQSQKSDTYTARLPFGSTKQKHKVVTKSILYKRYRDILFRKVALGYLLHFVQNGSSKNILKMCFAQQSQTSGSNMARLPFGSTNKK